MLGAPGHHQSLVGRVGHTGGRMAAQTLLLLTIPSHEVRCLAKVMA
jgi:hypothetical protein